MEDYTSNKRYNHLVMKKAVITVIILSISAGILFWKFGEAIFQKKDSTVNLTVWGMAEDEGALASLAQNYETSHPNIKLHFVRQSLVNYLPRLSAQLESGQGPDIFPLHSAWMGSNLENLAPAPQSILSTPEVNRSYYPVVNGVVINKEKIFGLPTEIDGLAMFVNEDILKAANVAVPKTWAEFLEAAKKVTVKNSSGGIVTSGAAFGTTTNVDFWQEILGLLFYQQPNGELSTPNNRDGAEVLTFYTSFMLDPRNKTWDINLPSSTQMFISGNLAFYFAPVKKYQEIKGLNPELNFKMTVVPQLSSKNTAWGSFWALGVSKRSPHQKEAWELVKFLTSSQTLQTINLQRTQTGFFPRVYPRIEMASQQLNDPVLSLVTSQNNFYKSWYITSVNGGSGMSQDLTDLYKQAVDAVLQGSSPENALSGISGSIKTVLAKYGVAK